MNYHVALLLKHKALHLILFVIKYTSQFRKPYKQSSSYQLTFLRKSLFSILFLFVVLSVKMYNDAFVYMTDISYISLDLMTSNNLVSFFSFSFRVI